MNRRNLLTAATASVLLPGAVKAGESGQSVHPDAELLAAFAAHDDLERAYLATGFDHDSGTPEYDAAEAEQVRITFAQKPYVDRICEGGTGRRCAMCAPPPNQLYSEGVRSASPNPASASDPANRVRFMPRKDKSSTVNPA